MGFNETWSVNQTWCSVYLEGFTENVVKLGCSCTCNLKSVFYSYTVCTCLSLFSGLLPFLHISVSFPYLLHLFVLSSIASFCFHLTLLYQSFTSCLCVCFSLSSDETPRGGGEFKWNSAHFLWGRFSILVLCKWFVNLFKFALNWMWQFT